MSKAFFIDYIRQLIIQTLEQEHIKNPNLVGGDNQVNLFSFYEQLVNQSEVDRYVEMYKQLADQQNRSGLIANGIIASPENPTITNINKGNIVPLSFTCAFRLLLEDRDLMLETIDNLIAIHKGRKVDIAQFDNGKLFMVGTIGNNVVGTPMIRIGDFIGTKTNSEESVDLFITARLTTFNVYPYYFNTSELFLSQRTRYLYFEENNLLKVAVYNVDTEQWEEKVDDNTYDDVIFPPQHNSFTKWCVSMSFDSFKCSEPRTLNANDYCDISFGGSATICSSNVVLGNQLTKVGILRDKIKTSDNGSTDYDFNETSYNWLEPLELPSGNNPDTQVNSLLKNNFLNNSHTNSINITNEYTFICDDEDNFLNMLFKYGRYGIQRENNEYTITPNTIFKVKEIWSKWGVVNVHEYSAKISGSVDIENTESDTLTITLPLQTQGEYN